MGKGAQWSSNEDLELVRSWISLSEDPLKGKEGTDQKRETFWGNIYDHWFSKTKVERSVQSIKNRWSLIQKSVQKFAGYYQKILDLNESGTTDEDKLAKAEKMYLQVEESQFQLMGCCMVLNKSPKWAPSNQKRSRDFSDEDDAHEQRPVGAKRAKHDAELIREENQTLKELTEEQKRKTDAVKHCMRVKQEHMLIKLLMHSDSARNREILNQITEKYVASYLQSNKDGKSSGG